MTTGGEGPDDILDLVRRVRAEGAVLLVVEGTKMICLSYDSFVRLFGAVAEAPAPSSARRPVTALSPREEEVLGHISRGLSAAETSAVLRVSLNTTNQHLQSVRRKFGVHSTREAVLLWQQ